MNSCLLVLSLDFSSHSISSTNCRGLSLDLHKVFLDHRAYFRKGVTKSLNAKKIDRDTDAPKLYKHKQIKSSKPKTKSHMCVMMMVLLALAMQVVMVIEKMVDREAAKLTDKITKRAKTYIT